MLIGLLVYPRFAKGEKIKEIGANQSILETGNLKHRLQEIL